MIIETIQPSTRGSSLVLIGYRGTGKSTVGRILASRLGWSFFDLDREIEARSGRSVREIFEKGGESTFRDIEERTLAELTEGLGRSVLATGGGAILRKANRERLREFGFVAWLTADPSELGRRIEADRRGLADRPALTSAGTLAEIIQVLEVRTPLYMELAHAVIETDDKSPDQVADAILAHSPHLE